MYNLVSPEKVKFNESLLDQMVLEDDKHRFVSG